MKKINIIKERWVDLIVFKNNKYYKTQYKVSNFGRVYSKLSDKILKQNTDTRGYKQVAIFINNKRHMCRIHRLVLISFRPNNDTSLIINHKNGNKADNRLSNLEYCTYSENLIHAYKNNLHGHGKHSKIKKYDVNLIEDICKLLSTNTRAKDIKKKLNLKGSKYDILIHKIYYKQRWKSISDKYF